MYILYWNYYHKINNNINNSIEGKAKVEITFYHAENIINKEASGSIFYITDNVKLTVR